MIRAVSLIHRTALGVLLGEGLLLLGIADIVRARLMVRVAGGSLAVGFAPLGQAIVAITQAPCDVLDITFNQNPFHLFGFMLCYWALLGVLIMHVMVPIRRLLQCGSRKGTRENRSLGPLTIEKRNERDANPADEEVTGKEEEAP